MGKRLLKVAIAYDFDGTLSPGNMQEYNFLPELGIKPSEFWEEVGIQSKENKSDMILMYMYLMLKKARSSSSTRFTKQAFLGYGKNVDLFAGVADWFDRINKFAKKEYQIKIEHYIISSGNREIIEGTPIAKKFHKIYASSYVYDQNGVAQWPALAVNYTTKTQFLFRINKGALDEWDNSKINKYISKEQRDIPFTRMIYIGDGETDIPCMKLVKDQGGYSIAVYKPNSRKSKPKAESLFEDDRVNFIAPADYKENSVIDRQIKTILNKIAAEYQFEREINIIKPRKSEKESKQ